MSDTEISSAAAQSPVARYTIDASPDAVFLAWITPELVADWWGPEGFTTVVLKLDFAEGGEFKFEMTAPNGESCCMTGIYRQIQQPSLLVMEIIDHCNLGLPKGVSPQLRTSVLTVEFIEQQGKTEVVLSHTNLVEGYDSLAAESWASSLKKLTRLA